MQEYIGKRERKKMRKNALKRWASGIIKKREKMKNNKTKNTGTIFSQIKLFTYFSLRFPPKFCNLNNLYI